MKRSIVLMGLMTFLTSPCLGQLVDRARVETEAAGQAGEADRLFKLGEWEQALPIYQAERMSRAALGDVRYEAYALRAIGLCQANLGDDELAIATWNLARAIDLKRDDKGYAGYDDFLIAEAYLRLDKLTEGIASLDRAIPMLSQAIDRDHETDARLVMTRVLVVVGRAAEARPHVARAIALADELNDVFRKADAWASAGQVEGALGNFSLALERFADAQESFEQQGRAPDAAWMETTTASTLLLLGRPDLALARFEEAAKLHDHLEDGGAVAEDLAAVAGLQLEAGRLEPAKAAALKAVEKARDADDRPREVEARVRLAQVHGALNDWPAAAEVLDEAVALIRQVSRGDPAEQVRLLLTAAEADRRAKLEVRARQRLETAGKVAEDSGIAALKQVVEEARKRVDPDKIPDPPRPPK